MTEAHGFAVFNDPFTVNWQVGQLLGSCASGYNDVFSSIGCHFSVSISHFNFFAADQLPITIDGGNFIFPKQKVDATTHAISNRTAAFDHGFEVSLGFRNSNSEILSVLDVLKNLCTFQEGLCRYAPPVQANPTERFSFDNSHLHSELRCAYCCHVAAGTAANYNQIIMIHRNCVLSGIECFFQFPNIGNAANLDMASPPCHS